METLKFMAEMLRNSRVMGYNGFLTTQDILAMARRGMVGPKGKIPG